MKWGFIVPMVLMSIVGFGVLTATFGQIVYGTLYYTKVNNSLWISYAGTSLGNMTICIVVFMILGLLLMISSIFTGYVLVLMSSALGSQLIAAVFAIIVALDTAPEKRSRHFAAIEANYTQLDHRQFEIDHKCSGVRSSGCMHNCCDEYIEAMLSEIFTLFEFSLDQEPPYLLLFSLFWTNLMSILIPSVVGMVAKRRDNEKKFRKDW